MATGREGAARKSTAREKTARKATGREETRLPMEGARTSRGVTPARSAKGGAGSGPREPRPAVDGAGKAPAARWTVAQAMAALEKTGTEQNRKTYARHGAEEPMFGVSFAEIGKLAKSIRVDHELACALWETGNSDARTLAVKIADPERFTARDLDRWVASTRYHALVDAVAALAADGPHGAAIVTRWLAKTDEQAGRAGWTLVAQLALRDEALPDTWFGERLEEIESGIAGAANRRREAMNLALLSIGGRSAALRDAALTAAKRIGTVRVDHGETACRTPDATPYIGKMWAHAKAKGFASPAAQERARPPPRVRC